MLDCDNQQTTSPIYVRDRRIPALQAEPNAPLTCFSPLIEDSGEEPIDMTSMIEAKREATERRLKMESTKLRRFHQQICVRVNERVLQQREKEQSQTKKVDEKLARLLRMPSAPPASSRLKDPSHRSPAASRILSRELTVETLLQQKRHQCQGADRVFALVKNAMGSDAQAREVLLASTRVPRVRLSRGCEHTLAEMEDDNQLDEGTGEATSSHGRVHVELPVKQRLELYAAVRRRYMAKERERVQQRQRGGNQKPPTAASRSSQGLKSHQLKVNERRPVPEVAIIDASVGCETKLQRQSSKASSTPWRKSPSAPGSTQSSARDRPEPTPPSAGNSKFNATQKERFLNALQEELGTPALCSCGRRSQRAPCANNCAFYGQSKKKERFAASVCQQHQAAST